MKFAFSVLVLLMVVAGAYWAVLPQTGVQEEIEDASVAQEESSKTMGFEWEFEEAGYDKDDTSKPLTSVSLAVTGRINRVYNLGVVDGSCNTIEDLLPGEVSAVLCWWGGGGPEFGVFAEGEDYVVKKGLQDEPTAETNGFRGDFKTLFTAQ